MKTLYIARHAKALLKSTEINDLDRPLLRKGEVNTRFIINYLIENGVYIEQIITSHAIRAIETAKLFASALSIADENIAIDSQLYFSGTEAIINELYDLPDYKKSIMIIGHNPSITSFVNYFVKDKVENVPTSGVVCIKFNVNKWQQIPKSEGEEVFRIFPKTLKKTLKYAALAV